MNAVATDTFEPSQLDPELVILNIGHGLGYLPYLQQSAFPNAFIDSMDIDEAMFTVSREWFCFDSMMDGNSRVSLITHDGIEYIKELWADPGMKQYDIINVDVFDSCEIIPFFESKVFFRMLNDIWRRWNAEECRPRMLVMNVFHPDESTLTHTDAFRNAVSVFGREQVTAESHVVLSVQSVP